MNSFKDALKMINTGFDCGVILQIGSFYYDSEIIKYMIIDLGKKIGLLFLTMKIFKYNQILKLVIKFNYFVNLTLMQGGKKYE